MEWAKPNALDLLNPAYGTWWYKVYYSTAIIVPNIKAPDFTGYSVNLGLLVSQVSRRYAHFSVHFGVSFGKFMGEWVTKGGERSFNVSDS